MKHATQRTDTSFQPTGQAIALSAPFRAGLLSRISSDPAAECRWWNSLAPAHRRALAQGAKRAGQVAENDWLDIGETNRLRILDAAYAVECWLSADR